MERFLHLVEALATDAGYELPTSETALGEPTAEPKPAAVGADPAQGWGDSEEARAGAAMAMAIGKPKGVVRRKDDDG